MRKWILSLLALFLLAPASENPGYPQEPFSVSAANDSAGRKVTAVTVEQRTSQEDFDDRCDTYEIRYDNEGKIVSADSGAYAQWERYISPYMVFTVLTPGTDYYEYFRDGSLSRITRRDADGKELFTINYSYVKGLLTNETYQRGDKTVDAKYEYDEDGRLTRVIRDEGNRTSTLRMAYHADGTFSGMSSKVQIENSVLDYSSKLNYNPDGSILSIILTSGNMLNESTSYLFSHNSRGELETVTFNQGYFQVSYLIHYTYSDVN